METVMFLGRFQPFHLGHLHVVKELLQKYNVVLAIGSANISRTEMNPFTVDEREEMIRRVFKAEDITVPIVKIPDIPLDNQYATYVKSFAAFDTLACSNKFIQSFFEGKVNFIEFPLYKHISGTKIREHIFTGADWKQHVHPEVAKYLEEIQVKEIITHIGLYLDE
jgi:nicotinamide-nucleotide adenylyltransferase